MRDSDTREWVTAVLDFPSDDGLAVYESGAAGELIAFLVLGEGEDPMVDDHD